MLDRSEAPNNNASELRTVHVADCHLGTLTDESTDRACELAIIESRAAEHLPRLDPRCVERRAHGSEHATSREPDSWRCGAVGTDTLPIRACRRAKRIDDALAAPRRVAAADLVVVQSRRFDRRLPTLVVVDGGVDQLRRGLLEREGFLVAVATQDLADDALLVPALDLVGFAPSGRRDLCESPRSIEGADVLVDRGR